MIYHAFRPSRCSGSFTNITARGHLLVYTIIHTFTQTISDPIPSRTLQLFEICCNWLCNASRNVVSGSDRNPRSPLRVRGHSWEKKPDIPIIFGLILRSYPDCTAYLKFSNFIRTLGNQLEKSQKKIQRNWWRNVGWKRWTLNNQTSRCKCNGCDLRYPSFMIIEDTWFFRSVVVVLLPFRKIRSGETNIQMDEH
jgi:hypothetical protein